jgi:hypothetical protein
VPIEIFVRFVLAILLNAFAFILWDVGTRPPLKLASDVAAGVRVPRVLAVGVLRFVVGAALLMMAADVARPGIPSLHAFTLLETGMLIAALLVETFIGPGVRRRLRGRV